MFDINALSATDKATPTATTNSFGVPVAIAWRNFTDTLAEALVINPDLVSYAAEGLAIAASHLKALGLDAGEIDPLIAKLESAKATLDHVETAICELLDRDPSHWAEAAPATSEG
jgi:hypothetical protein